jgi:putative peptide zinc metalloprotease protein
MSADAPLQSSLWYRVAPLRPRLLARAKLYRHHYRGERWYLLQDPASARVHRFTPAARLLLAAMDGERTVETLWQLACRRLGDDAPTQDEIIQLLGQLHASDLLSTDVSPDVAELFERGQKQKAAKSRRSWANPMAIRIPLVDPGRFLDRFVPLWRVIWGLPGALLWLAVVLPALLMLPAHWPDLTGNLSDRVLAADNLLLVALVFPLIKALHELGHATATRATGGEVHDMGIMMLVLMPIPYVDASSSTVLRSRWRRALIGAAGMVVELFIAALAFYVWLAVEPGFARAVCFNIMLVAGVSTVVFNGNPLLRYDAYYILGDITELPNLGQRSTRYWGYLFERYSVRVKDAESNVRTGSERLWLFFYGLLSFVYRMFVTMAIALFIGAKFFFIGVLLALWAVTMMAVMPFVRALRFLQTRQALRERRTRIIGAAAAVLLALGALAFYVPVPQRTQAQGVVWLPEQSILHAGANGFVRRVEAVAGAPVVAGQTLVERFDPALEAEVRAQEARVAELDASYRVEFVTNRPRAEMVREQRDAERAALARTRARLADMPVTAPADGNFTIDSPQDLPGRWHRQGDVIGYVLGDNEPIVRVVVEQADAGLVGTATRQVHVRLADDIDRVLPAHISRQVPAGRDEAPSRALVGSGGGQLAMDPTDPQGRKTIERTFQFDLTLDEPIGRKVGFGQRVYVRFDLAPAPLATQAWRTLRRLFLRHFDV